MITGNTNKSYRHELSIAAGDIDQLGHVNNVVYLKWAQDAAEAHWKTLASEKERRQLAWVVLRHEIDYRRAAKPASRVFALTWVGETAGVRSVRHVQILEEPAHLLAEIKTTWCLVDPVAQRPLRIDEQVRDILGR